MRHSPTNHTIFDHNDYQTRKAVEAYGPWVSEQVDAGWKPFILSFMFNRVPGTLLSQISQVQDEVERIYATLLTRIVRKPASLSKQGQMPRWLVCPDFPVPKHARVSVRDVTLNNGLHMHGIAMLPPVSRLIERLDEHFVMHQDLYVRPGHLLCRVHAKSITDRPDYTTNYVLKSVFRGRVSYDHLLILPQDRHSRFGTRSRTNAY